VLVGISLKCFYQCDLLSRHSGLDPESHHLLLCSFSFFVIATKKRETNPKEKKCKLLPLAKISNAIQIFLLIKF
jgi:hypothetical protein